MSRRQPELGKRISPDGYDPNALLSPTASAAGFRVIRVIAEFESFLEAGIRAARRELGQPTRENGSLNFENKVALLRKLVKKRRPDVANALRETFTSRGYHNARLVRNVLCHGQYIGRLEDGSFWFKTNRAFVADDSHEYVISHTFSEEFLLSVAENGEKLIAKYDQELPLSDRNRVGLTAFLKHAQS